MTVQNRKDSFNMKCDFCIMSKVEVTYDPQITNKPSFKPFVEELKRMGWGVYYSDTDLKSWVHRCPECERKAR